MACVKCVLLVLKDNGFLRIFNRMRWNYNCQMRGTNSSCRLFEKLKQPAPIPDDLYAATNFDNDLDWVIVSQENTGSHPHNDPDLTGAWNYLINGYKWWVIFPNGKWSRAAHEPILTLNVHIGLDAKYINCDDRCSPDIHDHSDTYRWFHHVLPQIRNIPVSKGMWTRRRLKLVQVYGNKPWEFVQGPGEAVYLPHGLAHTVLNVRDNVAVTENFLFVDALPGQHEPASTLSSNDSLT